MELKLTALVENFGDAGYLGTALNIKDTVLIVQGATIGEVVEKLANCFMVKIAHDYGLDVGQIPKQNLDVHNYGDIPQRKNIDLPFSFC